jgi:predicted nucleic acid-binding Zn ribbon protein
MEPLGMVLRRDGDLRAPPAVATSPVAFRDWEAAVGTRIAARARPMRLERGVLLVTASTSTWAQELSMLSADIVAQLRSRGVPVDSLRFRVGQVDPPDRPPQRDEVRREPPLAALPEPVAAELSRIGDDELRRAIALAARKNLGWQEALKPKKRPR